MGRDYELGVAVVIDRSVIDGAPDTVSGKTALEEPGTSKVLGFVLFIPAWHGL